VVSWGRMAKRYRFRRDQATSARDAMNAKRILLPTLDFPQPVRSQVRFSLRSLIAVATLICIAAWVLKNSGPHADFRIWTVVGGTVLGSLVGLIFGRPLLVAAWVFVILASIFAIGVWLAGLANAIDQDNEYVADGIFRPIKACVAWRMTTGSDRRAARRPLSMAALTQEATASLAAAASAGR
jgi:hypothetical protein